MTLPATGAISLSQVNTELGLSATASINMNASNVRTLFGKASGAISMSDGYGKANQFAFTISSNQANANLRTLALNAGWNGTSKVVATINSGVYISASTTGGPALTVDGSWPGGVQLVNNGTIVGMGGNGGQGGNQGTNDGLNAGISSGGGALSVSSAITITNNGTIAGGGGGGGGGAAFNGYINKSLVTDGGGGGGGGRSSLYNSAGGGSNIGATGGGGTISAAGAGGYRPPISGYDAGGSGGGGGGWGASGASGTGSSSYGGAGSGAGGGYAVSGNGNITWAATGTRLGAIS